MASKPNRNDPCHCGSGKKYKHCHQGKDSDNMTSKVGIIGVVIAVIIGLVFVGLALSGGESSQNCPPGTVWSEAHQHCH